MGIAPGRSTLQIPDITNWARDVASRIGVPAGHVQIHPAQTAAAGVRHRDRAGSIGEEVDAGRGHVWRLRHEAGADARNRPGQRALFVDLTGGGWQNLYGNVLV